MFFCSMETERLLLQNISFADRAFIQKQFSDDAVNRYLFDAEPIGSPEAADEIIRFYLEPEPRAQHRWVLVRKADGEKIGTCGFHCWDRAKRCVDVGYDLQPQYWRQGVMAEALGAVLPYYAEKMDVSEIRAHIYVDNERSIRLAQKLGFVFAGETELESFRGRDYLHRIYTLYCGK